MKRLFPLLPILALLVVSCGHSQEKLTRKSIQSLSELAELGTVEYTVKKIVKTDDAVWWKYGKRKIIFSCTAFIKAGIDMKDFSPENIKPDPKDNSVSVILPRARILSFNMPPEEIRQEFSMITGLRDEFTPEQKQQLLRLGEEDIREEIPAMGIIEDAESNARVFFTALFSSLGYEKIEISFR